MNCGYCGRDLNAIGQDNMSHNCEVVVCEDCNFHLRKEEEDAEYMAWMARMEEE